MSFRGFRAVVFGGDEPLKKDGESRASNYDKKNNISAACFFMPSLSTLHHVFCIKIPYT